MGKFKGYWEMREGGPKERGREVFKCTHCNATSRPAAGHSGTPDPHKCKDGCHNRATATSDWSPVPSDAYRDNYAGIFGHD